MDTILVLDFGSQYTQLIARRIREIGVYCEILPWDIENADVIDFYKALGFRAIGPIYDDAGIDHLDMVQWL